MLYKCRRNVKRREACRCDVYYDTGQTACSAGNPGIKKGISSVTGKTDFAGP